jgi:hypothetical protein
MQATLTAPEAPRVTTARAPRVLFSALALGVATQALFFRAALGLDWLVWDLMMIGVTVFALARGPLKAPAIGASVLAALLGAAFVFHRSDFTSVVAILSNLAVLAALPVIVAEELSFAELGELPMRVLHTVFRVPFAMVATVLLPRDALHALDGDDRNVAKRAMAGLVIGLPISGMLTLLLCGDVGFASAIGRLEGRLDTVVAFGVRAAVCALFFAFAHGVFSRPDPSALAPFLPVHSPYRTLESELRTAHISPLTWSIVLGQIALVFLLYAFVHRDTEFGGHDVVRARGALTYASNLHAGFYQLLLATMLSVGVVVAGHRLLKGPEEKVSGGRAVIALEASVLVLTGVALYSCAHRLRLYEEAYGATLLRLGVAFVVLSAFVVLATTLIKSLFRGFRLFGSVTITALSGVALAAAWFDADGYVARKNVERPTVDVAYLASLSADACAIANHPKLAPEARKMLVSSWNAQPRPRDLRALRGFTRCP